MSAESSPADPHAPATGRGMFAWAMYDWANSAFATLIQTFVFAAYFTRSVAENETVGTAQWGNAVGIAGLVVALAGPLLGAVADQGGRRKPWIGGFTLLCVAATAALWWIRPSPEYVTPALVLVGLGIIGAESAAIFYNAMLPSLALPERLGRWSGWGWALGYLGGLACLVIALLGFIQVEEPWLGLEREQAEHVRATFILVAFWYAVFALPLFVATPDTPTTGRRLGAAARAGVAQLARSVREARRYGHILRFLIARMIYTDGLATVFTFGGVYAAGTFDMDAEQVLAFGIALNVSAGLGALAFSWLDDHLGARRTIVLALLGLLLSGSAILLATSVTWFWVFGVILGVFVGPAQASSRSYLARVAPAELRNELFGLYAFSGKATAFAGPLLVGWLTYFSGSQRVGMTTVLAFFAAGLIMVLGLPEAASGSSKSKVQSDGKGNSAF